MGVSQDAIRRILERAVNAPSGDNAQPWRFRLGEESVEIFNSTDADPTLYNFRERGSYVAIGAVAENIRILAAEAGYSPRIRIIPGDADTCSVLVTFTEREAERPMLGQYIDKRVTNRAPYDDRPIPPDVRDALHSAARDIGVTFTLAESRSDIADLSRAVSTNEMLLMENRGLHDALFHMIRFSRKAEREDPGMYIKTMQLPLPVEALFRTALRSWTFLTLMNKLGFSKAIPQQTSVTYAASAAFGVLTTPGESAADFVSIGRAFQRLWLTAASHGLSLQPTAAIPYLAQRIKEDAAQAFSSEHQTDIKNAYATIARVFKVSDRENVGMMFRIGYGPAPRTASYKAPPIVLA